MINEVYAIYDESAEYFCQFLCFQNSKIARMAMEKMFKEKRLNQPMIYDYPNTFKLYKIATFDDNKGLFNNIAPSELILDFGSLAPVETVGTVGA